MHVGTRVVRGPDWRWRDEDGGEGHAGTVVKVKGPRSLIKLPGSTAAEEKCVTVIWDNGEEHEHRAGKDGAFDLRVLDNAPCGKYLFVSCREFELQYISSKRYTFFLFLFLYGPWGAEGCTHTPLHRARFWAVLCICAHVRPGALASFSTVLLHHFLGRNPQGRRKLGRSRSVLHTCYKCISIAVFCLKKSIIIIISHTIKN